MSVRWEKMRTGEYRVALGVIYQRSCTGVTEAEATLTKQDEDQMAR